MTNSSNSRGAPPKTSTSYSRFIPREELGSFSAWKPGSLHGRRAGDKPPPEATTPAADAAAVQAQVAAARSAGYQDGYRDGLVALESFKQSFASQMAAQIGSLVERFDAELARLEQPMAQAIAESALRLARGVVRSELSTQPETVAEVAQQAVNAVLLSARHIRVLVHPEDLPLVATGAAEALKARGARLVAQPEIERGGCLVESDLGRIDARIEARWLQAAAMLGSKLPWTGDAVDADDAARAP